eukprot:TRINITY_DN13390_c0_g2_i1.p1 TRINITY_DN13390_c0_g2~~TRINITY_DN13390_c0_g2_i1.p1  ORF type:complete len:382 (-),score=73.17 TRINITY_DN13390_c0_g2_i1:21-1166(-)
MEAAAAGGSKRHGAAAKAWPPHLERLLQRLWRLLQRLPTERRRSLLERSFSEQQRLLLERWVLGRPSPPQLRSPSKRQTSKVPRTTVRCTRRIGKAKCAEGPRSLAGTDASPHLPGIMRCYRGKAQNCYFAAHAYVGCLQLLSKTERRLEVALRHLAVLLCIRRRFDVEAQGSTFESRFRAAVFGALSELDADPEAIGLRFVVSIRTLWISSPLRSPPYRIAELEAGLCARRLLWEARAGFPHSAAPGLGPVSFAAVEAAWAKLRQAYARIAGEAGSCPRRADARLRSLEVELQQRLQQEAERHERQEDCWRQQLQKQLARKKAREVREQRMHDVASGMARRAEANIEDLLQRWHRCEAMRQRCAGPVDWHAQKLQVTYRF